MRMAASLFRLPPYSLLIGWVAAVLVSVLSGGTAHAVYRDGFDTPAPTWQLANSDCGAQIVLRERVFQRPQVHSGVGAEFLRIAAGQGSYAYISHAVPPARVIHELRPSLWVKANRPGIQLRARVVLPRSRDPRDGKPLTIFVDGDIYQQPGVWRQLTITEIPLQVQRKARIKRAQPQLGPHVDERESYIDMLVLNAYGGPGNTDIWIDDLEIAGYSQVGVESPQAALATSQHSGPWQPVASADQLDAISNEPAAPNHAPHLDGATLIAGRGPVAIRMIEHQGEPFAWLKSLGFNAIRLPRPPSPEQLDEARQAQIGLVAPPPQVTGRREITPAHDMVWAWDLGTGLGIRELESARRLAQDVRRDDPRPARPLVVGPLENQEHYRRFADVLLLGDDALERNRGIEHFRDLLTKAVSPPARPTLLWAFVQTEPSPTVTEQLTAFQGNSVDVAVEASQMRLLVLAALEAGATGICFRSRSRLDAADPIARHRAAVLQALNQELLLIEPWLAGPAHHEQIETGVQGVTATVWSTDRSKLILLSQRTADDQYSVAACPAPTVSFLVSGAPPSWKAYRVSVDRLKPVWSSQVGGGMRIVAPEIGRSTFIVATDDALTVNFLSRRLRQNLSTNAKVWHAILGQELTIAEHVLNQAPENLPSLDQAKRYLADAQALIRQGEFLLDASDFAGALSMAQRTEQALERLRRLVWSQSVMGFASRSASPCCVSFAALPIHWALAERIARASWGPNSLAAGDFENFQHLLDTGWVQYRAPNVNGSSLIELSPDAPQQGRYSLRLHVAKGNNTPIRKDNGETPLIRITSAPTPLRQGDIVRVTGWIRVKPADLYDQPLLRISDSLGRDTLAEYHRRTEQWRQFAFYRAADRPASLVVEVELLGAGDVWIDNLRVEPLLAPSALSGSTGSPPHQGAQRFSARKPETFAH